MYFSKQDPNYSMLKEIFNFIDSRKSHEIIASFRIKSVKTFVNDLKIWYLSVFFNYELSFVVDWLNNNSKLKKNYVTWIMFQQNLPFKPNFSSMSLNKLLI